MRKFAIEIDGKPFISATELDTNGNNITKNKQFRITFTSRMRYTDNLAFLDLGIYNLSKNTAIKQGAKIILSAGYSNEYDRIFTGYIITVLKEKEGPNVITRLICRSSHFEKRPSIQKTIGAGGSILDALNVISNAWNLPLIIEKKQFSDVKPFIRGYSLNGDLVKILRDLARQFDFSWLETPEGLLIDRNGKTLEARPREVSMFTGMIGFPESEGDLNLIFINVTMRLSPRIRLRTMIDLKSEYASYSTSNFYIGAPVNGGKLDGVYKVVELVHRGDSWGNRWQTEFRGQKV